MADPRRNSLTGDQIIAARISDAVNGSARRSGVSNSLQADTAAAREAALSNKDVGKDVGKSADKKDATQELERAKKDTTKKSVSLLKLFQFADKTDVFLLIVGTLGAVATGAAQPFMTVLFGQIINAFGQNVGSTGQLMHQVSTVALRFVYLSFASGVAAYLGTTCWMVSSERQAARIRSQYLRAILRQDIEFFDTRTTTGEVIARMSGDTVLVQEALGEKAGKVIQLMSTFIGGYIVAFTRSWKLTLVVMSVMPLIVVIGGSTGIFIAKMTGIAQAAYAEAGTLVEQVVGSIRTVAAYTGEKKAVEDYDKNLGGAQRAGNMQGLVIGAGFGSVIAFLFFAYGLALWYGGSLVLHDGFTGGQVINVVFAVLMGAMAIAQGSPSLSAIATGRAAAYSIFEVIKRTPAIDSSDMSGIVPEKINGNLELRKVDFRYPSRPEVPVFSNFSLKIPAGKTVALVGESGSGKSTVVNLIERFYDPEAGQVLLDGVDIKTIQLKWLRQQIGLVSQEPVLFSASIKENIRYGKEDATMEEVEHAAALANAAQFIGNVPQGYDTMVGERGVQLSGGQKQRVAIARAILKNPRILLLDEATSALDAQSERVVQNALDRVMTNRTTVVVAHRLTTIRNADMIAVVDRGVIVETGTHSELIRKEEGAYSQLIRLQEFFRKSEPKKPTVATKTDPDYIELSAYEPEITARNSVSARNSVDYPFAGVRKSGDFGSARIIGGSKRISCESYHGVGESKRLSTSSLGEGLAAVLSRVSLSRAVGEDLEKGGKSSKVKDKVKDVSIWRLAKLNKPELPLFIVGSMAASGAGLVFPVFGLLLSSVISAFFEPRNKLRADVNFWAGMFAILGLGAGLLNPTRSYLFAVIGQKLIRRVRRLTFEKVVQQEIAWFDQEDNSSGAISSRLSNDAAAVRSVVGDALAIAVQNIATIVAGVAIAFTGTWELTFVMLAVVPLLAAQGMIQVKWMKGFGAEIKAKYEDTGRIANDAVSSVRTVQSFVAEDKICQMYDKECEGPVRSGINQGLIGGTALGFGNFVLYNTFALVFWVGGKLVENGSTTFKGVFRVFFAISLSANAVTQTTGMSPDLAKVKIAVNSIFEMLDRKSKIDPTDPSGEAPKKVTGNIEFKHVSFFYPTRPDVQVFSDLSFQIRPGQTLALVGESGSGKSTVVSLLERFYDPQSGEIFLDGKEIRKLQIKWLRQQMGLVSQEPVLFDENVDWNIVYGQEGQISEGEIQEAAKAANAHKFISALPDGYKTRVGERGTQISGGQKQRVAIARAILKNPKILLLDEATSALDAESEHVVQEALDRIMVNRTTIVIAHRLSTVRNADIIAVVKNGGIVEQGKHDELMAKDGAYASLVKLHAN